MSADSTLFNMQGNSMYPVLRHGDQGLMKSVDIHTLRIGDIVVFRQGDFYLAHRLIRIDKRAEGYVFTTKGDFNSFPDNPFTEEALAGTIVACLRNGKLYSMSRFTQKSSRFFSLYLSGASLFFRRIRFRIENRCQLLKEQLTSFCVRFKRMIAGFEGLFIRNAALSFLQGVVPFLLILCIKKLVDQLPILLQHRQEAINTDVLKWLIVSALLFFIGPALASISRYVNDKLNDRTSRSVFRLLHEKHIRLRLSDYELPDKQDAMHKAAREAGFRPVKIVNETLSLIGSGGALLAMVALFMQLHWYLVALLILAVLPGTWIRLKYARRHYRLRENQNQRERRMYYFSRILTGEAFAKELRLFGFAGRFMDRFEQLEEDLHTEKHLLLKSEIRAELLGHLLAGLLIFISLVLVVSLMSMGLLSIGSVVLYMLVFQRGYSVLGGVFHSITGLAEDNVFLTDFFDFLDRPELENERTDRKPDTLQHEIRLENVSFCYGSSHRKTLSGINLTIPAGSTVAIVGPNGSGKTTLLKLLCGFYQPSEGQISYDGTPLQELDGEVLRDQITAVFQDYALYNLSAAENVALGNIRRPFNEEQVKKASEEAGIAGLLEKLPDGYETQLGHLFENGEDLSLGQWQKIAIARAYYRDAPLLFMDEPTSALDAVSERQILGTLNKLGTGKTVVVISHRLTTVCNADRIFVLDKGKLVEEGNHPTLMAQKGLYYKLFLANKMNLPEDDQHQSS